MDDSPRYEIATERSETRREIPNSSPALAKKKSKEKLLRHTFPSVQYSQKQRYPLHSGNSQRRYSVQTESERKETELRRRENGIEVGSKSKEVRYESIYDQYSAIEKHQRRGYPDHPSEQCLLAENNIRQTRRTREGITHHNDKGHCQRQTNDEGKQR